MPVNHPTRKETEALALLAEECGELVQVICKCLRHGIGSDYADNRELLAREIGDVLAAIHIAVAQGLTVGHDIEKNRIEKLKRVGQWLHYIGKGTPA